MVEAELDRRVRKAGDASQGVRVLPLQHGICLDARTVYVLGVNDGVLPARRTDDLIVPRELSAESAAVVEHADWHRRRLRRGWDATVVPLANSFSYICWNASTRPTKPERSSTHSSGASTTSSLAVGRVRGIGWRS